MVQRSQRYFSINLKSRLSLAAPLRSFVLSSFSVSRPDKSFQLHRDGFPTWPFRATPLIFSKWQQQRQLSAQYFLQSPGKTSLQAIRFLSDFQTMDQNSDEGQNGRKPRSRKGRGQRSQPEPGSSIPTALATSSTPSAGWPQFQTTQQLFFPLAGFGGNGVFTQDAEVPLQAGFFNSNPFSAGSPPPVSSSDNTPTGFLTRNQAPGIVSYFDPSKAFRTGMEAGNRGKQRPRKVLLCQRQNGMPS